MLDTNAKNISLLFLLTVLSADLAAADNYSTHFGNEGEVMMVYQHERSIMDFVSLDSMIKIGVGFLGFMLLMVSALAYYRERRIKFFFIMLAFLIFTLKGILGWVDLLYPGDSPFVIPFSDSFDFIILMLFSIAILKE